MFRQPTTKSLPNIRTTNIFPSYLVYSRYEDAAFHILFAIDVEGDNVRIITAYSPDPEEWENDFKTRRTTL